MGARPPGAQAVQGAAEKAPAQGRKAEEEVGGGAPGGGRVGLVLAAFGVCHLVGVCRVVRLRFGQRRETR